MDFNCYIDESGDEGISTGGSRWFILGALIVPSEHDLKVSGMVSRIKQRFGKPDTWPLHWVEQRKNHDRKLFICRELLTERWAFVCVAADKQSTVVVNAAGLRQKWHLYFYATRLLVERLSWYARDSGNRRAKLIFERRTNMSYEELVSYLKLIRTQEKQTSIAWDNVDCENLEIRDKGKSRLLQACDCVCGAMHDAIEYSELGNLESRYIESLHSRFYRRDSKLFSYGLTFLDADKQAIQALKREYDWLNRI